MEYSMPGFPVHHQLLELAQTHVYWVSDAIQPSHPLSSPSPPVFNLSQHQGLFQWVSNFASSGQSIGVSASVSVLPMNIQDWFPLGLTGSIASKHYLEYIKSDLLKIIAFFPDILQLYWFSENLHIFVVIINITISLILIEKTM